MSGYDVIPTRTYQFDDNGIYAESQKRGSAGLWDIVVAEREILIPEITIHHIHARSVGSGTTKHLLISVDASCVCGKPFPKRILDDIYAINKKYENCYTAIERGAYYRLDLLKQLADNWYLDSNANSRRVRGQEPALFHICNLNHPAYLYYGRGIPISQIAMPPYPDKCKTCRLDIPKGIRLALLIMSKGITLR